MHRQVAQAANADDTHPVGGLDPGLDDGVEDRDTAAEERPGLAGIQRLGDRGGPGPLATHHVGETAVAAHQGPLNRAAEVVVAVHTVVAVHAAAGIPPQSHQVTDLDPMDELTGGGHPAHHLVSGDQRVLAHAPFVVQHAQVGVADAAVLHLDVHLVRAQLPQLKAERLQGPLLFHRRKGVYFRCAHLESPSRCRSNRFQRKPEFRDQ